ncbi:response regulator [Aeoliella mucimassa]|uniref:Chemotaxis protein CheY n=1 Tax=Aeoliella mucimassa TaxID=2527972 RepID=A0A518ALM5_9BACT|nr:response regulator [Aeoliella mucimassa]QDU55611.1 Chemotaxis protein CheY [Aeoliella mucimassa]
MRALIADDAKMMRTVIRRTLEGMGVDGIVEAEDGTQAIDAFRSDVFDIVLTDWNMPFKNGLEVLKAIRESDSKVPVIVITTEGQQKYVLEAVKAGVSDYILKPFEAATLKEKVEKLLPSLV